MRRIYLIGVIAIVFLLIVFLISLFIFSRVQSSGEVENSVSEVIDGDTFRMSDGEIVRLLCVDTPEKDEKGYDEAKVFLERLLRSEEMRIERRGKDKYGRSLGFVYVNLSSDVREIFVNREIIREGYGKVFDVIDGKIVEGCDEFGSEGE